MSIYYDTKRKLYIVKVYWKSKGYYFSATTQPLARKKENELNIQIQVAKRKGSIPEFVVIKEETKSTDTAQSKISDKQSLAAMFDLYEKYSALRINPRSLEVFQSSRKSFVALFPGSRISDINAQSVEDWKYQLQVKDKRRPGGVKRYLAAMASCFSYLKDQNHFAQNPFSGKKVMKVKGGHELKPYLLAEEVEHLLETSMLHEIENQQIIKLENGMIYPDFGMSFLIALGCYAGLRPGESVMAKWGWIQKDTTEDYTGTYNSLYLPNLPGQTMKS